MTSSRVVAPEAIATWKDYFLVDAREIEHLAGGHLPNAVHVSPKEWDAAAKTPENSLQDIEAWSGRIGALGIDGSRKVAVYDDGRLTDAARVWLLLQGFGVDAYVVDGGWPRIASLADSITEGIPPTPEAVQYSAQAATAVELLDRKTLAARLSSDIQIWDARTAAEYDGSDARKNPRPGRLPKAKLINHLELIGSDGRLLPDGELVGLLDRTGFNAEQPIAAYCEGGGRAALAALAAVQAGYRKTGAYYLSFQDWSPDTSVPVER